MVSRTRELLELSVRLVALVVAALVVAAHGRLECVGESSGCFRGYEPGNRANAHTQAQMGESINAYCY